MKLQTVQSNLAVPVFQVRIKSRIRIQDLLSAQELFIALYLICEN
jgi:hypothetical protein